MRWLSLLCFALSPVLALAVPPATTQPARTDYVVSPMRLQTLEGATYEYVTIHAVMPGLKDALKPVMEKFKTAMKAGTFHPTGPSIIIFHDMSAGQTQEIPIDVGFPVAEDTKPAGDFQVQKLEPFRCATVLYNGPTWDEGYAYEQLYSQLYSAGLEPTKETRQSVLVWQGEDSQNNVMMIQIQVK